MQRYGFKKASLSAGQRFPPLLFIGLYGHEEAQCNQSVALTLKINFMSAIAMVIIGPGHKILADWLQLTILERNLTGSGRQSIPRSFESQAMAHLTTWWDTNVLVFVATHSMQETGELAAGKNEYFLDGVSYENIFLLVFY